MLLPELMKWVAIWDRDCGDSFLHMNSMVGGIKHSSGGSRSQCELECHFLDRMDGWGVGTKEKKIGGVYILAFGNDRRLQIATFDETV